MESKSASRSFGSRCIRGLPFLGYPAVSVLFVVLGLGRLWGPWGTIAASGVILSVGMLMWRLIEESRDPFLATSIAPYVFFFWAWFSSVFYAVVTGSWLLAGLAIFLDIALAIPVADLLKKRGFLDKLDRPSSHRLWLLVWFMFILSSAVPTSVGLARLNHVIDLLLVIFYGMAFGWFSPEVMPRLIPRDYGPLLVIFAHPFLLTFLYMLLETIDSSLTYPTLTLLDVVLLSYVACYAMFVSRSIMETFRTI